MNYPPGEWPPSVLINIIQGRLIARIAILNLRTTAEIIEEVVNAIRTFVLRRAVHELESRVNHD
jgi:hypothetical protein